MLTKAVKITIYIKEKVTNLYRKQYPPKSVRYLKIQQR